MLKKITAKEAEKILKESAGNDGITFYAIDTDTNEIYAFDTKKERDNFTNKQEVAK